jgi:hypothetical protein
LSYLVIIRIVFERRKNEKYKNVNDFGFGLGSVGLSGQGQSGRADFVFGLFDEPNGPGELGAQVIHNLDVIDGYFTVELDFGSDVFDGSERWLQIEIRPGELNDPNGYTLLNPRQEVTPVPYALQTRGIFVNSAGKVGIGTKNPQVRLSLGAEIPPAPKKLAIWDGIEDFYGLGADWGRMTLYANNEEKMTITDTGNVGIGTTDPGQKLDVDGGNIIVQGTESFDAPGEEGTLYLGSVHHYIKGVYGFGVKLGTYSVGDVLSIRELSGNVGIGTDSPSQKLEVEGHNPRILIDATSSNPELNLQASGRTRWSMYQDASTGDLRFYQAGNKITFEDTTGNVGIGTISPDGKLTAVTNDPNGRAVSGEATSTANETNYGGYFVANGMLGHGVYGWGGNIGVVGETSGNSDTGVLGLCTASGTGVKGEGWGASSTGVEGSGWWADFYASGQGTDYASASSIRWKKDVSPMYEPLEKVMSLRGVHFRWDEAHGGHKDFGMIAEEVGEVLPEIVVYEQNGIDATGMDYSKLTPLLVEAVKELRGENDRLKERVEALERTIHQLAKIKELEL